MVSLADAAKRLGISRQAIGQWCVRVGAPTVLNTSGRRVPLWPDFPRWREKELVKGEVDRALAVVKPKESEANSAGAFERRKAEADARRAEITVAQLEGELISQNEAVAEVDRFCSRLRGTVRGMKSRHANDIIGLPDHSSAVRALECIADQLLTDLQAEARANAAAPAPVAA